MRFLRDKGLTIVLMAAFFFSIVGMWLAGWQVHNKDLIAHGATAIGPLPYLLTGAFISSVFENWESEFLQMSTYVVATAYLFQRGSAESKDPDKPELVDEDPATRKNEAATPWPVKAGGWVSALYSYSLGIALGVLFIASFVLHWTNSARAVNELAVLRGEPAMSVWQYLGDAELWFESFQNWQSEFLSTAVLVVFSIFLRYRGSPESKPVAAPDAKTGSS